MNKKIISGIVALTMVASMAAFTANAQKLGDVNDDTEIDIIDAVTVINYVNGVKPLEGLPKKCADVNEDKIVDIEDAVTIINHINGVKPIANKDITESQADDSSKPDSSATDSQADDSSKPDSSTPDSSKPDSSVVDSQPTDSEDSSKTDSKPDSSDVDSQPDDSSKAETKNTEDLIKKASDKEFRVEGEGKVDYSGKKATVKGFVEQKDGVTHFKVSVNGDEFEETYTVDDKTYVKDGEGAFVEGASRFGNLAKGKIADLIASHSGDMGDIKVDGNSESFDFKFYDSIFAKKELEVTVTITYDANGNPTAISAVNKADGTKVFDSIALTFSDTTDDIDLPASLKK